MRARIKAVLPVLSAIAAALLWWPAGFAGIDSWLHLPLRLPDADLVFLGTLSAATLAASVARAPWPRAVILIGLPALGWLLSAPSRDSMPYERPILAGALLAGTLVGLGFGASAWRGPLSLAVALAVVAGASPAEWPEGALVAVALALPFVRAQRDRVAPTLFGVLWVLVAWLVAAVLALALRYGWDAVRPGSGLTTLREGAERVAGPAWDFLRTQWWTAIETVLRSHVSWFWAAAVLAILIVAGRAAWSWKSKRAKRSDELLAGAPRR